MFYRSFQFYLDFANGDVELAGKIEMLVMKSVKDFADDLAKRLESEAENEGEVMVSLGLNRAALISAQHPLHLTRAGVTIKRTIPKRPRK